MKTLFFLVLFPVAFAACTDHSNDDNDVDNQWSVNVIAPDDETFYGLLDEGSSVSNFTGIHYQEGTEIALGESDAELIILDFWFMTCQPCVEAVPHLQELYKTYKSKGLEVWGVNRLDNTKMRIKRFPAFLDEHPIDYPIVLVDSTVDNAYQVRGYPTLYVLDKERRVIFRQIGYDAESGAELDSVIAARLGG